MRPIARQSARLASHSRSASCSRSRHASVPPLPAPRHIRAFRSSVHRPSDARPPNDQPNHNNAGSEQQREEQRKAENGTAKHERPQESEPAEKTAGEGRRPATTRRALRQQRRFTDVPKPPPIPDWFLQHNVFLVKHPVSEKREVHGHREEMQCVDGETGHILFTVPHYDPSWAPARVTTKIRDKEIDITILGIDEGYIATLSDQSREDVLVRELLKQRARKPQDVDHEAMAELLVTLPRDVQESILREEAVRREKRKMQKVVKGEALAEKLKKIAETPIDVSAMASNFFDYRFDKPPRKQPGLSTKSSSTDPQEVETSFPPLSWVLLEAENSVRAALALPADGQHANLYASSRVDLALHCPDSESHAQMDTLVRDLAGSVTADVVQLDANDFEELTAEYVGGGQDSPGSYSTLGYEVFDGYVANGAASNSKIFPNNAEEDDDEFDMDEDDFDEDEDEDEDSSHHGQGAGGNGGAGGPFSSIGDLRKAMHDRRHELSKALSSVGIAGIQIGGPKVVRPDRSSWRSMMDREARANPDAGGQAFDPRLTALLEGLVDGAKQKRAQAAPDGSVPRTSNDGAEAKESIQTRLSRASTARMLGDFLRLDDNLTGAYDMRRRQIIGYTAQELEELRTPDEVRQRTIIHVRELKDIHRSSHGSEIIRHLVRVVQKRRRSGESIMIVGTTAQSHNMFMLNGRPEPDGFSFRKLTVPPLFGASAKEKESNKKIEAAMLPESNKTLSSAGGYPRILEINLRHLQSMLRRLRPGQDVDLLSAKAKKQMSLQGTQVLAEKVLSLDQVQRVILGAIGLADKHAKADDVSPVHIALATHFARQADQVVQTWSSNDNISKMPQAFRLDGKGKEGLKDGKDTGRSKVEEIKSSCNQHEGRLLNGVVDAKNIKTGFAEVHAPAETIEALKTLTTLSLLRPEAFSYGVLAADRLPGLLLYGPPGTGKTLLAKAVAKESKATVLEITGAQIYEKYVGEGEKMVRAVFSLAKKLSPCVVFIDEADAIFGSRSNAGNRNTHREIINQFLREWDGMDGHGVFIMVASNRPFDLDDAVMRRLPRRLLVDLPVVKDRESILGIHLKTELLDPAVSLAALAERTPLYSGSDLKNLCVAAALACVREENEALASHKEDGGFKLPDKRVLAPRHFDKAIAEISASISEDMSSLTAIRKFDEQFGDRRGRRKKAGYGFGVGGGGEVDESSVRVRRVEAPVSVPAVAAGDATTPAPP